MYAKEQALCRSCNNSLWLAEAQRGAISHATMGAPSGEQSLDRLGDRARTQRSNTLSTLLPYNMYMTCECTRCGRTYLDAWSLPWSYSTFSTNTDRVLYIQVRGSEDKYRTTSF